MNDQNLERVRISSTEEQLSWQTAYTSWRKTWYVCVTTDLHAVLIADQINTRSENSDIIATQIYIYIQPGHGDLTYYTCIIIQIKTLLTNILLDIIIH